MKTKLAARLRGISRGFAAYQAVRKTASVALTVMSLLIIALAGAPQALAVNPFFSKIADLNYSNGGFPVGSLVKGSDGDFYGMTSSGGASGAGTVFKMTAAGVLTKLVDFGGSNGAYPRGSLVQGSDGNFYGLTTQGGYSYGTVFKMTAAGVLTNLANFDYTNGASPQGSLVQGSDGNFYGMANSGGANNQGTAFKMTAAGLLTKLVDFGGSNGYYPQGNLVQGSDGNFYGMANSGGANGLGTAFKMSAAGVLTKLVDFGGSNGSYPQGNLVQDSDGNFYGVTPGGGANDLGTAFKMTPAGVLTKIVDFDNSNGAYPNGNLSQGSDGDFYGMTSSGGASGAGTVFKMTAAGVLTKLVDFDGSNGANPQGGLVQGSDGNFYGLSSGGGVNSSGTVFKLVFPAASSIIVSGNNKYIPAGLTTTSADIGTKYVGYPNEPATRMFKLHNTKPNAVTVTGIGLSGPGASKFIANAGTFPITVAPGETLDFAVAFQSSGDAGNATVAIESNDAATPSYTFAVSGTVKIIKPLAFFAGSNGTSPYGSLVQGSDGNFYGLTQYGGVNNAGTAFKVTPAGVLTKLVDFGGSIGGNPSDSLVQGSDGNFYGLAPNEGANNQGTAFKMTAAGVLTKLVDFGGSNGANPYGSLVQGSDGIFYGMTLSGGANGYGTVFKITSAGVLTKLVDFGGSNGANPQGSLVQGSDGLFYGMTLSGGANGDGTVFKLTSTGVLTKLVDFNYSNGSRPNGSLVQGRDGDFYGMASQGGSNYAGTAFKVTAAGVLTKLVDFDYSRGISPFGSLVQGRDGNFYGMANSAGSNGFGTTFMINAAGVLTKLAEFEFSNGAYPNGSLVQGSDGNFYGMTRAGGPSSQGTVFKLYAPVPANSAPTDIALSAASIDENNVAGAIIGTLSATDADAADTHTFSFAGGVDDAAFTITGNTLTINGSADFEAKSSYFIRIRATDSGAGNLTYEKNLTVTINDVTLPQSIVFGPLAGKTFGDANFGVSATGGASGQPVTFSIVSGPANIAGNTVSITGAGSVTVRASQEGAGDYSAAADVEQSFTVARAAQSITFTNPGAKTFGDAAFALVATGGGSGNAVTFSIVSGPASVAGNQLTITGAGSITVRASQAGNDDYLAAPDVEQTFSAAKAAQSISFTNPGAKTFGDAAFALVATDGGSGNAVTFSVVSGSASVAGNLLTITGAGSITVRASQAGNADYFAAPDVEQTFSAAKAAQSITFTNPGAKTFGDAPFALSASGGASGEPVTFSVVSGPATIAGDTVTITGAGSVTVRASQAGNANYLAAPDVEQTFSVASAAQTITFAPLGAKTFGDAPFVVSATGGASGEPVTFSIESGPATISGSTVAITGAGSVTVRASQAGAGNYAAATPVDRTFTVAKAAQSITFTAPARAGTGETLTLSATGGASGNAVTFSVFSGPGLLAGNTLTFSGAGTVVVRASQAGNANYEAASDVNASIVVLVNKPPVAVDDAVTSTTGSTVVYPLANDTDADGDELTITAVSESSVAIAGDKLIVPGGYTGTFSYTISDGSSSDSANVVVSAGAPVTGATNWTGLLYDGDSAIAGSITANKSASGRFTGSVRIGAVSKSIRFSLNASGVGTATTALGALAVTQDAGTGRLEMSLVSGVNTYTGSLRPSQNSATATQLNIALASLDKAAIPGGGFATASVKADGSIAVVAQLPDGRTTSQKARLADNGSFVIYAGVRNSQGTGFIGGELVTANLASTDVTGELAWTMGTQIKGLHLAGVNTTLTANGCIFTQSSMLPGGAVSLRASGGNLAAPLTANTTATAGVPVASAAFSSWVVKLSKAGEKTGTFTVKVKDPAKSRSTSGSGVYLPKSNSAWGFFPGTTVGGRIELMMTEQ